MGVLRYALADGVRSQRILAPAVVFGTFLAMLYAVGPNPAVSSYGVTALALFPVAAWCTAALLGSEDPVQREVTAVNAGGTGRASLAKVLAAATVVLALAIAAVVLPWLFGTLQMPEPTGTAPSGGIGGVLPYLGLGLLAHLVAALPGVGIGALWSPPAVRRAGITLAGTVVCLVLAVPLDSLATGPRGVARVIPHVLPPFEVARQMVDGRFPASVLHGLAPSLLGALAFTAAATAVHLVLARRRF